jgi:four helix bundle suffix protein
MLEKNISHQQYLSDQTDPSDQSDLPEHPDGRNKLRSSGGYRQTASFQTTTIIYDATWWFCEKFLDAHSRLVDQMLRAARAGRQKIAEGSRGSGLSSKMELRLLRVARSSLEELRLDFEDFLRQRRLPTWASDGPEAQAVREVSQRFTRDRSDLTDLTDQERWTLYAPWLDHADPAVRANAILCLIQQASFLLDQQIDAVETELVEGGGEPPAAARLPEREWRQQGPSDRPHRPDSTDGTPACPQCGKAMVLRTAKSGKTAGKQFWGCPGYPQCKGTMQPS